MLSSNMNECKPLPTNPGNSAKVMNASIMLTRFGVQTAGAYTRPPVSST